MRTGLLVNTSRVTPPKVAVTNPRIAAHKGSTSLLNAFSAPMTQKAPMPKASAKQSSSWSSRQPLFVSKRGQVKNVTSDVIKHILRYVGSRIQNTCCSPPSTISLRVPPPVAVTVPITRQPNTSMPFLPPAIVPTYENKAVPTKSNFSRLL